MIEATCHCGTVRLRVAEIPGEVTDCNCSICRRYGVLWAYYRPREVSVDADTPLQTYIRDGGWLAFNRCPDCGCVTHWSALDPTIDRMAVNARLMPPEILAGARRRLLDGAVTEAYVDELSVRPGATP